MSDPFSKCENTGCPWVLDGVCDDGGPDSEYADCGLGEDCADCGAHSVVEEAVCGNDASVCYWQDDDECDDGGEGADYNSCPRGSDCDDCGSRTVTTACTAELCPSNEVRVEFDSPPASPLPPVAPSPQHPPWAPIDEVCEDSVDKCDFLRDGECDDGGPGAQFAFCETGHDCADCGARSMSYIFTGAASAGPAATCLCIRTVALYVSRMHPGCNL